MPKTAIPHSCDEAPEEYSHYEGRASTGCPKGKPADPRFVNGARVSLGGEKGAIVLPRHYFGDVGIRFDNSPGNSKDGWGSVAGMWQRWLLEQDDFAFLDEPIAARHRPRKKRHAT
jgi:hypothetical protein